GAVVVVRQDALGCRLAFDRPGHLPGEAVETVRLGREVALERDLVLAEAETRVADAVAVGHEREAGGVERIGRAGPHRAEDVGATVAQRGEGAADLRPDFGAPAAG